MPSTRVFWISAGRRRIGEHTTILVGSSSFVGCSLSTRIYSMLGMRGSQKRNTIRSAKEAAERIQMAVNMVEKGCVGEPLMEMAQKLRVWSMLMSETKTPNELRRVHCCWYVPVHPHVVKTHLLSSKMLLV